MNALPSEVLAGNTGRFLFALMIAGATGAVVAGMTGNSQEISKSGKLAPAAMLIGGIGAWIFYPSIYKNTIAPSLNH